MLENIPNKEILENTPKITEKISNIKKILENIPKITENLSNIKKALRAFLISIPVIGVLVMIFERIFREKNETVIENAKDEIEKLKPKQDQNQESTQTEQNDTFPCPFCTHKIPKTFFKPEEHNYCNKCNNEIFVPIITSTTEENQPIIQDDNPPTVKPISNSDNKITIQNILQIIFYSLQFILYFLFIKYAEYILIFILLLIFIFFLLFTFIGITNIFAIVAL